MKIHSVERATQNTIGNVIINLEVIYYIFLKFNNNDNFVVIKQTNLEDSVMVKTNSLK